jgi:aspartyl-tRNA(Asn)/glutamyl-tRNA(Gln) amidotransferase subunit C
LAENLTMAISLDDARWIAHLARLELSDDELQSISGQLSKVLDYIQQLQIVNTEGIEPLAHPLPIQNVFRNDEPGTSLPVDEALANAPRRLGPFYGVPAVFD